MHAVFEPIAGAIRVFEDGKNYGDPYAWAGTVRFLNPKRVEVLAAMKAPTLSGWRAMVTELKRLGAEEIIFIRKRADGSEEERSVRV